MQEFMRELGNSDMVFYFRYTDLKPKGIINPDLTPYGGDL